MLTYVPVVFDVYRPLKAHLRWTLQCLVGFADRSGKCFPSVRKLAEVTGISKSTVGRHLVELEKAGALTRRRQPGHRYLYQIDARFLPAARMSQAEAKVSHPCAEKPARAVPPVAPKEKTILLEENVRRADSHISSTVMHPFHSETFRWRARLRQLRKFHLWSESYGPLPGEPGCKAPPELVAAFFGEQSSIKDRLLSGTAIAG